MSSVAEDSTLHALTRPFFGIPVKLRGNSTGSQPLGLLGVELEEGGKTSEEAAVAAVAPVGEEPGWFGSRGLFGGGKV